MRWVFRVEAHRNTVDGGVAAVTILSLPVGLRWGLLRCVRYGAVDVVRVE